MNLCPAFFFFDQRYFFPENRTGLNYPTSLFCTKVPKIPVKGCLQSVFDSHRFLMTQSSEQLAHVPVFRSFWPILFQDICLVSFTNVILINSCSNLQPNTQRRECLDTRVSSHACVVKLRTLYCDADPQDTNDL